VIEKGELLLIVIRAASATDNGPPQPEAFKEHEEMTQLLVSVLEKNVSQLVQGEAGVTVVVVVEEE
jgi:hypothetical protein